MMKIGGEEQNDGQGMEENEDGWVDVPKPIPPPPVPKYVIKLPFPQRQKRNKSNQKCHEFLNIFKKLTIKIPIAKALEEIPSYVKFTKQIL